MLNEYQLIEDLHKRTKRQGPGGDTETLNALNLAMLDPSAPLRIADIGCGTGASTLHLAHALNAQITAVDFLPGFIDVLNSIVRDENLSHKITPLICSMDNLPFEDEEFDVIWSEGAIYNIGFKKGITYWKRFLKPGGLLAVSEITWTHATRPTELQQYWESIYPEIDTASAKIAALEQSGYTIIGYFKLSEHCWLDNYYGPLQAGFTDFLKRNGNNKKAAEIIDEAQKEIALYEKYRAYYSYGFYIARKNSCHHNNN
ncbi:MAG: methyltransferase domain-containing protein [Emcibacter sp.]|nr:methyltransferase domain-containing protein [Emcibacter sp.]